MSDSDAPDTHFGVHLTLDGYGGDFHALNDEQRIVDLLSTLPDKIGMHKLHEPQVLKIPKQSAKDPGGFSGFVIIAESHISVHTFPERGFVSADVYTCQQTLDTETAIAAFRDLFGLRDVETNVLVRGTRYAAHN